MNEATVSKPFPAKFVRERSMMPRNTPVKRTRSTAFAARTRGNARRLPPNKIKTSDSRSKKYKQRFGMECWELDALPPSELIGIIDTSIQSYIDNPGAFKARVDEAEQGRKILRAFAENYGDLADLVQPIGTPT